MSKGVWKGLFSKIKESKKNFPKLGNVNMFESAKDYDKIRNEQKIFVRSIKDYLIDNEVFADG